MENFGHTHKANPRITSRSRRIRGKLLFFFDCRITSCREQPWEGLHVRIYICQEIGFRLYINLYAYTQMELPGLTDYVENFTVYLTVGLTHVFDVGKAHGKDYTLGYTYVKK